MFLLTKRFCSPYHETVAIFFVKTFKKEEFPPAGAGDRRGDRVGHCCSEFHAWGIPLGGAPAILFAN